MQNTAVFTLVMRGRLFFFWTSASKFNVEPNGTYFYASPKTTVRQPMWKPPISTQLPVCRHNPKGTFFNAKPFKLQGRAPLTCSWPLDPALGADVDCRDFALLTRASRQRIWTQPSCVQTPPERILCWRSGPADLFLAPGSYPGCRC